MASMRKRAESIVRTIEHLLCDACETAMLTDTIELALKEQDRMTRHAVAEALSEKALLLDDFPVKGGLFLRERQAVEIAKNTITV
jgi:hypothetical protein